MSTRVYQGVEIPKLARQLGQQQPEYKPAEPPGALQYLLNQLYGCMDCPSEVRWDLKVGIAHEPTCPTMRRR